MKYKIKRMIRKEWRQLVFEYDRAISDIVRWNRTKFGKEDSHERWIELK